MCVIQPGPVPKAFRESPDHVRLSLAAAMTLGFVPGWFYRNARLRCVNLLLTYAEGCRANCAFCGLAKEKEEAWASRKFIRVPWLTFPTDEVVQAVKSAPEYVGRVCVSMITNQRCKDDVLTLCRRIVEETGLSVSVLISPSIVDRDDLSAMKDAGADRIGVAIDAVTPEIFHRLRGKAVSGPHRWDRYWKVYGQSLEIFGESKCGVHLICGLGETEKEMVQAISRAHKMGGSTHLFSFFPEKGSAMEKEPQPAVETYRRIQLARWLIDNDLVAAGKIEFDPLERIVGFGLSEAELSKVIGSGSPFETSGCPGPDGKVACNRPYGNEKPGPDIRNFPFPPEKEDLEQIAMNLRHY